MHVSNLDFQVKDEDLKQFFMSFGEVVSAKVVRDRETGRSRGFGFVEMQTEEAGNNAMTALNNKEINGRAVVISLAKQKVQGPVRNVWM